MNKKKKNIVLYYKSIQIMSGGGLLQIVAYGAQDIWLTGNPQVTFFKQLYRRHTNFSMQSVEAQFNGAVGFGRTVSVVVPRVGDLMGRTYLEATLPAVSSGEVSFQWDLEVGNFLIEEVEVQIGGQVIDKHYGYWLSIWSQLTLDRGKTEGYNAMVGGYAQANTTTLPYLLFVPLQFWFCRHTGLALPLIALQYHEVRIVVKFATFRALIAKSSPAQLEYPNGDATPIESIPDLTDAKLYIDYIFLDTSERRKMAQTSQEYLIDQLQFTGNEVLNSNGVTKIKLNFNHPVKELIWIVMSTERKNRHFALPGNRTNLVTGEVIDDKNPVAEAKLQFNGHDRFSTRNGRYFSDVQPYQHHTNIPTEAGINVYSFALYPELEQPSGTANFSRIDNATLSLSLTTSAQMEDMLPDASGVNLLHEAKIYAVNMNVLRIMSGMGGLAYSN